MSLTALPKAITVDHGTEFTSDSLDEWANLTGRMTDSFVGYGKQGQVHRPPAARNLVYSIYG